VKTGGRSVKHARYYWLLWAESHLTEAALRGDGGKDRALPVPTGQTQAMGAAKSGGQEARVRLDVCGMRWKDRISRFWVFPAGRQLRLARAKMASGGRMQFAGSKEGGWVYTGSDPGVQNGNPD
jgi:hypothetical protein